MTLDIGHDRENEYCTFGVKSSVSVSTKDDDDNRCDEGNEPAVNDKDSMKDELTLKTLSYYQSFSVRQKDHRVV